MPFVADQKFVNAYVDVPFSMVVAYEQNGTINQNVQFSCLSPLPGGLFFDVNTGEIYGTATKWAMSETIVIQVDNDSLRIMVNILNTTKAPDLVIKTDNLPVLLLKTDCAIKISVDGGVGAIQYRAIGLPKGMLCHPTTGVLYGRPIAFGGKVLLTLTVTDTKSQIATRTYWWKMEDEDVKSC